MSKQIILDYDEYLSLVQRAEQVDDMVEKANNFDLIEAMVLEAMPIKGTEAEPKGQPRRLYVDIASIHKTGKVVYANYTNSDGSFDTVIYREENKW